MLLLCALIAGSSSVWATPTTYNFPTIPTSGWNKNGSSINLNNIIWTYSSCTYIGESNGRLQIGSKNSPQTSDWTIKTAVSNFGSNKAISAVSITAYTTATTATYDISVGGTSVKSGSLTTSSATYSATGLNVTSGDIVITMKGSSTSKAMYLSNISVTYEDASTDPIIGASNQEIEGDATSGEFSYTISNPVENTSLTASVTAGDTWLSNPVVDATNNKVTFTTTQNPSYENSREGTIHLIYGNNLATKDVTITQAASIHKYTITIVAPSNGTLVVKNGELPINSGDAIADGTTLTITTTPSEGYRLKNWQAVDATNHTYTATFTYTINAHDVTISANFELIPEHTATFYINGTKDSEAVVKEGADITFPTVNIAGQEFLGWTTAAIEGTQKTKPSTLVTEATMGTADVDYYAVFGNVLNAYFDAADVTNTPKDASSLKWTHTATGIFISLSAGSHYTSGTPKTFTVTSGTSNYLQVTCPSDYNLKNIVVTLSGSDYKIGSLDPSSGTKLSTNSTTQTVTFTSDMNSVQCKATSNKQIRATTITVKALAYCTTIPTLTTPAVTEFGWATYVAQKDMEFPEGRAYVVTAAEVGSAITKAEVTQVPAGTPVLLKDEGTVTATVLATTPAAPATNMLSVCDGTIAAGKYAYVLAKKDKTNNIAGFMQWTGDAADLTNRVVMLLDQAAEAPAFIPLDGETTGINTVNGSGFMVNGSEVYNLNGQRVAQPTKGLYIVNGRKVVIK